MSDVSRRDWIKTVGVAGVGAALPLPDTGSLVRSDVSANAISPGAILSNDISPGHISSNGASSLVPEVLRVRDLYAPGDIVELYSTSEVFIPPRGRSFMKFSFDFPEPAVVFGDHRFGFLIFTDENTYSLDRSRMKATGTGDALQLTCDSFVWAGGQEKVAGKLTATFRKTGRNTEWDITVEMPKPIKNVTTVVRDVPRGQVSVGGGALTNLADNDLLAGYTFGAGDLHGAGTPQSMNTPVAVVQVADNDFLYFTTLDNKVRPKRYYFQNGEKAFRVEVAYEHDAWRNDLKVTVPTWKLGHAATFDEALNVHFAHIESAFKLPSWESRTDVPAWMRDTAMVVTMHGMHYTGFMFNTYAQQLEILRWIATQMPANRVLIFLASWDGRYYWDYPNYKIPARMGGEAGFRTLIKEGQKLGFRMMPMYGTNSANTKQPIFAKFKNSVTRKIDGNQYNLDWVDWNNDRHQDGWLAYMNLGSDPWRQHMEGRIADMIEQFGVDAYFLDIVGGHVNSTTGDMHEGTRTMIMNLRARYPKVVGVGEMPYDALYEFIPMFHAGGGGRWTKYAKFYSHLSAPAAGRGSSGVHEAGFGRFNTQTLGVGPTTIPTLQIVDDTFTKYRDVMAQIISAAKTRAGIF